MLQFQSEVLLVILDRWKCTFKMADWVAIAARYRDGRNAHLESASGVEVILYLLVVVLFHGHQREIEVAFRQSVAERFMFFEPDFLTYCGGSWPSGNTVASLAGLYKLLHATGGA